MSDNASLRARREAATPRGVGVTAPFFVQRAENSEWPIRSTISPPASIHDSGRAATSTLPARIAAQMASACGSASTIE